VLSLKSLRTLLHLKLNLNAIVEATVAVHLDGAEMDEYILAAGPLYKAIAFGIIKPLNDTLFSHYFLSCTNGMLMDLILRTSLAGLKAAPGSWRANGGLERRQAVLQTQRRDGFTPENKKSYEAHLVALPKYVTRNDMPNTQLLS
jgi:hypothetical protein